MITSVIYIYLTAPKLISVVQSGAHKLFSGKASYSEYATIMKFSNYVIRLLMIVKYVVLAFLLFLCLLFISVHTVSCNLDHTS